MRKKCLQCGQYYEARRSTSKYCSDKCRNEYHRTSRTVISSADVLTEARDLLTKLDALSVIDGDCHRRALYAHVAEALAIALKEVGM